MPLKKCAGGKGWQYGSSGKCYTGKDAKKKAIKQGLAEGEGKFKEEMAKGMLTKTDLETAIAELIEAIKERLKKIARRKNLSLPKDWS